MLRRKLRLWMFYGFDTVAGGGAFWRICGLVCLLVLLGIARFGWPLRQPSGSTPESRPSAGSPGGTEPYKKQIWERDDPTPLAHAKDKSPSSRGLMDRLRDRRRQAHDLNYQFLFACGRGDVAEIQRMLDQGADPRYRNAYAGGKWETPLMAAAASGNIAAVRLILAQPGVDPTVEGRDYETAWTYARTPEIRKLLETHGVHR